MRRVSSRTGGQAAFRRVQEGFRAGPSEVSRAAGHATMATDPYLRTSLPSHTASQSWGTEAAFASGALR